MTLSSRMYRALWRIAKLATDNSDIAYEMAIRVLYSFRNMAGERKRVRRWQESRTANLARKLVKKPGRGFNVIIVVVDSLRYRNLSFTGYNRSTTHFLDSFKAKYRALSASPYTYSSVPSILTGTYPYSHGAIIRGKVKHFKYLDLKPLRSDVPTLLEILRASGYRVLSYTAIDLAYMPFGDRLPFKMAPPRARIVLGWALSDIKKARKPFVAYIHLGDLHVPPLRPPRKFRDFFGEPGFPMVRSWSYTRPEEQRGEEFERYRESVLLLYDNTLRYVDSSIEWFMSRLEAAGIMDSTILVVTSDHGEEMWEHAGIEAAHFYDPRGFYGVGHGHNLFNEIIEVPVLIEGPPIPKVEETGLDKLRSTVDIMPTIADLLEMEHSAIIDGESMLQDKTGGNRPIISESVSYGYEKKALVIDGFKLLVSENDGVKWVFDLRRDPREEKPIRDPSIVSKYEKMLQEILRRDLARRVKSRLLR